METLHSFAAADKASGEQDTHERINGSMFSEQRAIYLCMCAIKYRSHYYTPMPCSQLAKLIMEGCFPCKVNTRQEDTMMHLAHFMENFDEY
jgi:hypothetical protein